jgi:hypothetical protein
MNEYFWKKVTEASFLINNEIREQINNRPLYKEVQT